MPAARSVRPTKVQEGEHQVPRQTLLLLVTVALLAVAGCTGGDDDTTQTPTPSSSSSAAAYSALTVPDLCAGITRGTLLRLHIRDNRSGQGGDCSWYESTDRGDTSVSSELYVRYQVHETDGEDTATEVAKDEFDDAGDTEVRHLPARGIGDQAKVYRHTNLDYGFQAYRDVELVVREANVVVSVSAGIETSVEGGRDLVGSFDEVESATVDAMRELLGELTGEPVPAPARDRYGKGEVERVGSVCASARAMGTRLTGAPPKVVSAKGARRSSACGWRQASYDGARLGASAEAMAPSRTTGRSASDVAATLFEVVEQGEELSLGDAASIDVSRHDGGDEVWVDLLVRRGNLLVSVEYERDGHPSQKQMRRDAVRVAKQVLAANR